MEENEQVVIIANRLLDLKKLCLREDPANGNIKCPHILLPKM